MRFAHFPLGSVWFASIFVNLGSILSLPSSVRMSYPSSLSLLMPAESHVQFGVFVFVSLPNPLLSPAFIDSFKSRLCVTHTCPSSKYFYPHIGSGFRSECYQSAACSYRLSLPSCFFLSACLLNPYYTFSSIIIFFWDGCIGSILYAPLGEKLSSLCFKCA